MTMRGTVAIVAAVTLAAVAGSAASSAAAAAQAASAAAVAGETSISGVVRSAAGPEAGVWVIAETDDLETGFRKIVVTSDDGRFLIPELATATYDVWVRGYGLADSEPRPARPGDTLELTVSAAATPREAAAVYPANYWYSLIEVPPPADFPGTGDNGINPAMRTQEQFIDGLKDGCQLCHQLGNEATREMPMVDLDAFDSTGAAWAFRLGTGATGSSMVRQLNRMGRARTLEVYADWTDRILAGEVPPVPPRPAGVERNLVLTMWQWSSAQKHVHDNIATDKRNPRLNADGPVYGILGDNFVAVDPVSHRARQWVLPTRDSLAAAAGGGVEGAPIRRQAAPSLYWDEAPGYGAASGHNPMMDAEGRVWLTSAVRPAGNPDWCRGGAHSSAAYFPLERSTRQVSYYDPEADEFVFIDSCYSTHHLQFAEDADDTLWFSGDIDVVGWLNTRLYDQDSDEQAAQGWCPTVIDTNGDGAISRPWNDPGGPIDPARDTRLDGFAYGVIPSPVDGSIWITRGSMSGPATEFPGSILRLDPGDSPPESCITEVYEPPFENAAVGPDGWGFGPRGIDVDRHGVIWTALSGSGHLASFDRRKCGVLNGPTATGQHCPEGWTLHSTPGPRMRGVAGSANADFHYYNWVDQFDTLGLGENVPMASGSGSDSLLALLPESGEWVVMRVPYPLGFYTRGLNGRIDDPDAGWKGRGLWGSYDTMANWHSEGGKGKTSEIVRFQMRPHPLAE